MDKLPPTICMIAGCNGSGKTTLSKILLPHFKINRLINPDEIAWGLNSLDPKMMNMKAGKIALSQMREFIDSGESFAFETTASGTTQANILKYAKQIGYNINLVYLFLYSPEIAKERVLIRTMQGGHSIPSRDIERRYYRGIKNILDIYLPLSDNAYFYHGENLLISQHLGVSTDRFLFAQKLNNGEFYIHDPLIWGIMNNQGSNIKA